MDFKVRRIKRDELDQLLELYAFLNPGDVRADGPVLKKAWDEIQDRPEHFVYLAAADNDKIVSVCIITIIPNLTRGSRPFAVIENVVTHPDYRRKGLGEKVMLEAIQTAKNAGCYKVMLLSTVTRKDAHRLYEKLGFNSRDKTGFYMKL
jgi:ribosomal protein S18 acetylase RimI-like enzyme